MHCNCALHSKRVECKEPNQMKIYLEKKNNNQRFPFLPVRL